MGRVDVIRNGRHNPPIPLLALSEGLLGQLPVGYVADSHQVGVPAFEEDFPADNLHTALAAVTGQNPIFSEETPFVSADKIEMVLNLPPVVRLDKPENVELVDAPGRIKAHQAECRRVGKKNVPLPVKDHHGVENALYQGIQKIPIIGKGLLELCAIARFSFGYPNFRTGRRWLFRGLPQVYLVFSHFLIPPAGPRCLPGCLCACP